MSIRKLATIGAIVAGAGALGAMAYKWARGKMTASPAAEPEKLESEETVPADLDAGLDAELDADLDAELDAELAPGLAPESTAGPDTLQDDGSVSIGPEALTGEDPGPSDQKPQDLLMEVADLEAQLMNQDKAARAKKKKTDAEKSKKKDDVD